MGDASVQAKTTHTVGEHLLAKSHVQKYIYIFFDVVIYNEHIPQDIPFL